MLMMPCCSQQHLLHHDQIYKNGTSNRNALSETILLLNFCSPLIACANSSKDSTHPECHVANGAACSFFSQVREQTMEYLREGVQRVRQMIPEDCLDRFESSLQGVDGVL